MSGASSRRKETTEGWGLMLATSDPVGFLESDALGRLFSPKMMSLVMVYIRAQKFTVLPPAQVGS